MVRDLPNFHMTAAPEPVRVPEGDAGDAGQPALRGWSVVAGDRLVGSVHGRADTADGKTIVTTPVLQVRLMGARRSPVAFTQSGSAYWLGDPAETYGMDAAEQFVWTKSRAVAPAPATLASLERTSVLRLAD
jgi:hypothetical protein